MTTRDVTIKLNMAGRFKGTLHTAQESFWSWLAGADDVQLCGTMETLGCSAEEFFQRGHTAETYCEGRRRFNGPARTRNQLHAQVQGLRFGERSEA